MPLVFNATKNQWYVAAVNPDTSAAPLATLEAEVNELKAALRDAGVISP